MFSAKSVKIRSRTSLILIFWVVCQDVKVSLSSRSLTTACRHRPTLCRLGELITNYICNVLCCCSRRLARAQHKFALFCVTWIEVREKWSRRSQQHSIAVTIYDVNQAESSSQDEKNLIPRPHIKGVLSLELGFILSQRFRRFQLSLDLPHHHRSLWDIYCYDSGVCRLCCCCCCSHKIEYLWFVRWGGLVRW